MDNYKAVPDKVMIHIIAIALVLTIGFVYLLWMLPEFRWFVAAVILVGIITYFFYRRYKTPQSIPRSAVPTISAGDDYSRRIDISNTDLGVMHLTDQYIPRSAPVYGASFVEYSFQPVPVHDPGLNLRYPNASSQTNSFQDQRQEQYPPLTSGQQQPPAYDELFPPQRQTSGT